jgi:hypothetical protein
MPGAADREGVVDAGGSRRDMTGLRQCLVCGHANAVGLADCVACGEPLPTEPALPNEDDRAWVRRLPLVFLLGVFAFPLSVFAIVCAFALLYLAALAFGP